MGGVSQAFAAGEYRAVLEKISPEINQLRDDIATVPNNLLSEGIKTKIEESAKMITTLISQFWTESASLVSTHVIRLRKLSLHIA